MFVQWAYGSRQVAINDQVSKSEKWRVYWKFSQKETVLPRPLAEAWVAAKTFIASKREVLYSMAVLWTVFFPIFRVNLG